MNLSDILIPLSSLAALLLPGILKRDAWAEAKPWLNGIIAGAVVALLAALTVWAGGQFTGNVVSDWALFAGAYGALLAGPFAPLDQYLQSALNLPFLKPAPVNANPLTGVGTKAAVPTAIPLPSNVPQRASAQDQPPKPGA